MSTIIAGRFEQQTPAHDAVSELVNAGFHSDQVSTFYVNPAGRHGTYPIGGDVNDSKGSEDTGKGMSSGMAPGALVGAVVGAVATPLTGPLGAVTGALVGAHVGSLPGSLSSTNHEGSEDPNVLPHRRSGVMVAVTLPQVDWQGKAVEILKSLGADDIECAEGTIANGDWQDFDAISPVRLLVPPRSTSQN
ncbi:MAG: hypothetical protein JWR22_283 [Herminiimonas sp.]|nr:hypothetical protein [Herminiimonas sp.]